MLKQVQHDDVFVETANPTPVTPGLTRGPAFLPAAAHNQAGSRVKPGMTKCGGAA